MLRILGATTKFCTQETRCPGFENLCFSAVRMCWKLRPAANNYRETTNAAHEEILEYMCTSVET